MAVACWAGDFHSLGLGFLICKTRVNMISRLHLWEVVSINAFSQPHGKMPIMAGSKVLRVTLTPPPLGVATQLRSVGVNAMLQPFRGN